MDKHADISSRFDRKGIELGKALYLMKSTLDLDRVISLNAHAINQMSVGKAFFGHVQRLSLEFYVLGICKVFEQENKRRKHELHSLPALLDEATTYKPLSEVPLRAFVAKYTNPIDKAGGTRDNSAIEEVQRTYEEFVRQHAKDYGRLRRARDKMVAHFEYLEPDNIPKSLPSYDFMERLLLFAVDLHSAISRAYLGVHPHPIREEGRVAASVSSVLQKLGIRSLKRKFDDDE